jgi:PAP2 superfamily
MIERVIRIALTVLVVAGACLAAQNPYFLQLAKAEYSFFAALLSVTILHLRIRHARSEFGVLALSTLTLMAVASRAEHFPLAIRICWALLGLASLAILAIRTIWCRPAQIAVPLWALVASLSLIGSGWIFPLFFRWAGQGTPKVLDLYLCSFDASLGFQPSFAVGALLLKLPVFGKVSGFFYMCIPFVCTLVFGDQLLREVRKAVVFFLAFFLSGPIGALFYNLFPALGPFYLFRDNFPLRPLPGSVIQHMRLEPIALHGFRNAMPSLHMTWAILGLWYSRRAAWWVRVVAWAFLAFTIIGTLGIGEHYLADLIVAFPFSLMIFASFPILSAWKDSWRIRAIVFGFGATILWMTLLRFQTNLFWYSPVVPWAFIAMTLGLTLLLKWRLLFTSEVAGSPMVARTVADLSAE